MSVWSLKFLAQQNRTLARHSASLPVKNSRVQISAVSFTHLREHRALLNARFEKKRFIGVQIATRNSSVAKQFAAEPMNANAHARSNFESDLSRVRE
jgi:hypothetical protein